MPPIASPPSRRPCSPLIVFLESRVWVCVCVYARVIFNYPNFAYPVFDSSTPISPTIGRAWGAVLTTEPLGRVEAGRKNNGKSSFVWLLRFLTPPPSLHARPPATRYGRIIALGQIELRVRWECNIIIIMIIVIISLPVYKWNKWTTKRRPFFFFCPDVSKQKM